MSAYDGRERKADGTLGRAGQLGAEGSRRPHPAEAQQGVGSGLRATGGDPSNEMGICYSASTMIL